MLGKKRTVTSPGAMRERRITFAEFMEGLWHNFDLFEHAVPSLTLMEEHEAKQKAARGTQVQGAGRGQVRTLYRPGPSVSTQEAANCSSPGS